MEATDMAKVMVTDKVTVTDRGMVDPTTVMAMVIVMIMTRKVIMVLLKVTDKNMVLKAMDIKAMDIKAMDIKAMVIKAMVPRVMDIKVTTNQDLMKVLKDPDISLNLHKIMNKNTITDCTIEFVRLFSDYGFILM